MRLLRRDVPFFFEDHDGVLRRFAAAKMPLLRGVDGIVVTTPFHATSLTIAGIRPDKILTCENGVRVDDYVFSKPKSHSEIFRVVYAGNLFQWKGVFVLAEASRELPGNYQVEFIGGSPEAERPFRTYLAERHLAGRVSLRGYIRPSDLPNALSTADVLVLPNSAAKVVSNTYTSPLKLFEYMAAGRPIVASDVPAIRHILCDGHNAILVTPDDPRALAEGIRRACEDRELGSVLANQARLDVQRYTWDKRAARIAQFMSEKNIAARC